jgi:predicted metalloprotease with PDZ domain
VVSEIGEGGGRDYDDMVAGKEIVPPPTALSSCLKLTQKTQRPFELGFDEMSLAVVRGVRAGSQAESAGLVNGDRIISIANLSDAKKVEQQELSLVVARGEQEQKVSYLPRGTPKHVWHWEMPATGAANCKF